MKKNLILHLPLFIALALALACSRSSAERNDPPANGTAAELITRADQLYNERADLQKAREGAVVLRQARTVEPGNYEATWRLARMNYFLGEHTTDTAERDKAFSEGEAAAKEAIRLSPNKPEGHFWLGANLGGQAEHSALTGLSAAPDIRREMETVIKLDESFMSGSAYMVLARIDLETPPVLGGDPKRAVELLEKGLKFGENNPLLRYYLAQAYLKTNRKDDARKQLETIINMQPDPNYVPEHNDAVAKARELMKKVQG
ncbi:MAG: tetratricopeptide repeat protein [Pyrinomonadaceae bacterium]|nr:tetratricopeptide repeat protein [Pyrinomonadaceae bacterium]